MPIHLPFQIPRIPDFIKRPIHPNQTLAAFEDYAEKAIEFATRHGGEIGRNIMDDLVDAAKPYAEYLDMGVDALLPATTLWYGEKWAARHRDPFKQKGGVVRSTSSQSSAQRMFKRGRSQYDIENVLDDLRRKRRISAQERARGFDSMARGIPTGSRIRKFRKSKRVKKNTKSFGFSKRHYDDYGSLERDNCAYIGFQTHGSKSRLWGIIGEALCKSLLAKLRIYPRSYDEPVIDARFTSIDRLELGFKRVNVPGGTNVGTPEIYETIVLGSGTTFESLGAAITAFLIKYAERDADSDLLYAYYPFQALWYKSGGDSDRVLVKDIGESMVTIYANQVITMKNLTKNDSGTSDLDVVGTNPIHGRKYEFKNFRPRLIDSIEQNSAHNLGALTAVDGTDGINHDFAIPGDVNSDHILAHPPKPS